MLPEEQFRARLQCLEIAMEVAKATGNPENVLPDAENYWQWMNGSHDAKKTPDKNDDIPF